MTCARCRHSREIERLVAERSRLREICSSCRLGEGVAGDGSVSLDSVHDGTIGRVARVAPGWQTACEFDPGEIDEARLEPSDTDRANAALTTLLACVAALPYDQVARLAMVADVFRGLTRREFGIVSHLLNGGTMVSYAERHGLSKQTAFARIKALFRSRPVFRSIANGGLSRGRGAVPREERGRVGTPPSLFPSAPTGRDQGCFSRHA